MKSASCRRNQLSEVRLCVDLIGSAKARGVKLGNPELAARQAADAAARDEALRPVLVSMAGQSSPLLRKH
jgi:hypothetical protein